VRGNPRRVAKGRKLSIQAVADEAGISNATIHNRYPALADRIRSEVDKTVRQRLAEKQAALQKTRERATSLRDEVSELRSDLAKLASENWKLSEENRRLAAEVERLGARTREPLPLPRKIPSS